MYKRRIPQLSDSDSDSSDDTSNVHLELLSMAKKPKNTTQCLVSVPLENLANFEAIQYQKNIAKCLVSESPPKKFPDLEISPSSLSSSSDDDSNDHNSRSNDSDNGNSSSDESDSESDAIKNDTDNQPIDSTSILSPLPAEILPSNDGNEDPEDNSESDEASSSDDDSGSSSESEFNDGFDEQLLGDADDKKRLTNLSERERETEIFKRIEQRDVLKRKWEIEKKLQQTRTSKQDVVFTAVQEKKNEPKKPVVVVKEEENSNDKVNPKDRSKARTKNVATKESANKRSNAMAMLKAQREEKQKREEQIKCNIKPEKTELSESKAKKSSTKPITSSIYSDISDDSESELDKPLDKQSNSNSYSTNYRHSSSDSDYAKMKNSASTLKRQIFVTAKHELSNIRLSRHKLERFLALHQFDRIVQNCFVRINIGTHNNRPVYRITEIIGVTETSKAYMLGNCRTNKGLRLKFGASEKVFGMEFASNQDFTDSEFENWKRVCAANRVELPTLNFVANKVKEISAANMYEFEDVHGILEEKNNSRKYPINSAKRKATLMIERDAAIFRGDDNAAADFMLQIEKINERANELDQQRSSTIKSIAHINDRNRRKNLQTAEKSLIEEARVSNGMRSDDPFTRRTTKPTLVSKVREPQPDMQSMIPAPLETVDVKKPFKKPNMSVAVNNNLYLLHDFDIDLDVALLSTPVTSLPKAIPVIAKSESKRSASLKAFKKNHGII